jgi:SAM-dependent methyltransferase
VKPQERGDAARRQSAAAERNRAPILAALERWLPVRGSALEIASGTGQHAAHFAAALAGWQWQPTDADPAALASIDAWCAGLANVRPALRLDVLATPWQGVPAQVDAIFCANMLHIAPWPTCAALMQGAGRHLAPGGLLVLYGPYVVDGEPTAPSNLAFDADLRARNGAWGLRRLADVVAEAQGAGLALRARETLPANNLLLVLGRDDDRA